MGETEEAPGAGRRQVSRPLLALKALVTIGLCAWLLARADWARIGRALAEASPWQLLLVFAAMVLCVTISTWKWWCLLRIHGASFPFRTLHRHYFVAMFFNNFLPTSIGGDGYRVYRTWRNPRSRTAAVLAVFTERLTGIASLLLIGLAAAAVSYYRSGNALAGFVFHAGIAGLAVALPLALLLLHPRVQAWILSRPRLPGVVRQLFNHLGDYRRDPGGFGLVIAISLGFHAFSLGWMWLLIHALGQPFSIVDLAVVSAVLSLVAIVPLSINGIGLVDGSFIFLAGQFGLPFDPALAVMLIQRALLIPISVAGAWLYFRGRGEA